MLESLRQRNADPLKNPMVEEGQGRTYSVRGCPWRENEVKNLLLRCEFSFSFLDTQMASLKTTRKALFIGHASGFITDAEFLLLHQENSSVNLDFPSDNYPRVSLQDQSEADCKANFRLENTMLVDYVLVKSKLQHPPRPGQPPGHLTFLKIIVQIPPYPGQNAVQMPHTRVHLGDQMPPPRGHFTGT